MNWYLIISLLLAVDIIIMIVKCVFFRAKPQNELVVEVTPSGSIIAPPGVVVAARPHVERKVYVSLPCGAKILDVEAHEIADTPGPVNGTHPEAVRKGGVFFQCHSGCPFVRDCAYVKAFADLHLGKDFSLPLEHGRRLELKRRNGHRCLALVDETNVDVKTIPLTGVSYHGSGYHYMTVPPLFQDVEDPLKDDCK